MSDSIRFGLRDSAGQVVVSAPVTYWGGLQERGGIARFLGDLPGMVGRAVEERAGAGGEQGFSPDWEYVLYETGPDGEQGPDLAVWSVCMGGTPGGRGLLAAEAAVLLGRADGNAAHLKANLAGWAGCAEPGDLVVASAAMPDGAPPKRSLRVLLIRESHDGFAVYFRDEPTDGAPTVFDGSYHADPREAVEVYLARVARLGVRPAVARVLPGFPG